MRSPSLWVVGVTGVLCGLATMIGGAVAGSFTQLLRFGTDSDIGMVGWPLAWCIWATIALIVTAPSLAAMLVMSQWHGTPHRRLLAAGPAFALLLGSVALILIGLLDLAWLPWFLTAMGCLALTLLAQKLFHPRRRGGMTNDEDRMTNQ
jgi:hypothetical protein